MRVFPIVAAIVLIAAGCQSYQGDEASPYYTVPVGSTLILTRPITIPPDQVGALLQYGQIAPWPQINAYRPHCKFEVRNRVPNAQTVTPDEFLITRVSRALLPSVSNGSVLYARASVGIGIGIGIDGVAGDGPSVQTFATRMDLGSSRQPNVFRLTCGQWGYPYDGQYLSIDEIRAALGNVFRLQIPPAAK